MLLSIRVQVSKFLKWLIGMVDVQQNAEIFALPVGLKKAEIPLDRFREVISDPINLLIKRVPQAGYVDENRFVILHNGNRVHYEGPNSYYGIFSQLLVINRGVHEPLEEYCFQETLAKLKTRTPVMVELQFLEQHKTQYLDLHCDSMKIDYYPQSEAAL